MIPIPSGRAPSELPETTAGFSTALHDPEFASSTRNGRSGSLSAPTSAETESLEDPAAEWDGFLAAVELLSLSLASGHGG